MTARLLTILGTGPRHRVNYRAEGAEAQTSSIDGAIVKLFDVTHVTAFATEEAVRQRSLGDDLRAGLSDGLWPSDVGFELKRWPAGRTEKEFWDLFETFRLEVASACDRAGDGEVIVNLTHGFRTQPLIAQAAVLFELEDRRRRKVPRVDVRMLYGAYAGDWKEGLPTPDVDIWDMTTLVEAGAWASAVGSLREHARADRLEQLLTELKRRLGKARVGNQQIPDFIALGRAARELVDALVTNRTHLLKTAPANFLERWRQVQAPLLERLPALRGPLESFAEQVKRLQATTIASVEGVRAALEAGRWLIETEQFSAVTTVLRETYLTIEAVRAGKTQGHEPGVDCSAREELEQQLGARAEVEKRNKTPSLWGEITQLRNDVQHAAYNDNPTDAAGVRTRARDLLERVGKEAAVS